MNGPYGPCLADILIAHVHYIDLCINETAHTANSDAPLLLTLAASNSSSTPGFERLECLWRSVNAVKSWLDIFFTLSPSACAGFSFIFWAQQSRCLVILYRLSTLADPAWDRQAVRDTVNLLFVLDRIADKLEQTSSEAGERSNDDLFMQISRMTRMFRAQASAKIAPGEAIWPNGGSPGDMMDQDPMMQSIDFGNDMWWEDFFGRP